MAPTPADTAVPANGSAIKTTGLTKTYPGSDINAVSSLNLTIAAGSVYCLLGRNGAGKTTTIRMLTTLLAPSSGTAEVLGISIEQTRRLRPLIGVALQEVALDLWLTAREQLELGLAMAGWRRGERRVRVDVLVEQFGLGSFQHKRIGALSGGMRRRIDVALAVSHDPKVLFLDEPSSGLDIEGKDEVWNVIRTLRREGRTVVLTTHDMEEAVALSDHIGIIKDGELVSSGSTSDLTNGNGVYAYVQSIEEVTEAALRRITESGFTVVENDMHSRTLTLQLDSANAARIAQLAEALDHTGMGASRVEVRSTSLRDAFLEATR
jgi:ABC-2 type transport system ATP-binding protein